jgi:enolase
MCSVGSHEACELRDGDKSKWGGKGKSPGSSSGEDVLTRILLRCHQGCRGKSMICQRFSNTAS